jgi:hypothetical protein
MGIADQMGWSNPFTQFVGQNRNTLMGFGAGLAGGRTLGQGIAAGLEGVQRGAVMDDLAQQQRAEEEKRVAQINATAEFLRSKGAEDLAMAVENGMTTGADAFNSWYQQANAPDEQVRPIEINGQLVNPVTGEVLGDYRDPQSGFGNAPAGYQWNPDGTQSFIPGGPADPSTQAKTTEAQRRNQQLASVIQPELQSVERNWDALADGGNQTWGSNPVTAGLTSPEYQQARNSLAVIAQSYLYSVSGAAATDAEVQKIVDSVTPKPFESPQSIAAKKARIQQMADAVIQAGGGGPAMAPAVPGGQTSSGLQWSLEP